MTAVIELDALRVSLGKHMVLRDLTGHLTGRVIGLLGPNGAGKTTLVHTLLGFHRHTGTARLLGLDIRATAAVRALVGYMPERDAHIADMTGVRFLRMMGELSGLPSDQALERAHETMFYVGLGEARYRLMGSYSLGMKQLVKLAQALMHGPRLVFLDEPTNGLDPPSRAGMLRLIRDVADAGVHVVLSSHILRDVAMCCEEVVMLRDGRIAGSCKPAELQAAGGDLLEVDLTGPRDGFLTALQQIGCVVAVVNRRRITLAPGPAFSVADLYAAAAAHGVILRAVEPRRNTLEDVFFRVMEAAG